MYSCLMIRLLAILRTYACAGGLMHLTSMGPPVLLGTHRLRKVVARGLLLRAGGLRIRTSF